MRARVDRGAPSAERLQHLRLLQRLLRDLRRRPPPPGVVARRAALSCSSVPRLPQLSLCLPVRAAPCVCYQRTARAGPSASGNLCRIRLAAFLGGRLPAPLDNRADGHGAGVGTAGRRGAGARADSVRRAGRTGCVLLHRALGVDDGAGRVAVALGGVGLWHELVAFRTGDRRGTPRGPARVRGGAARFRPLKQSARRRSGLQRPRRAFFHGAAARASGAIARCRALSGGDVQRGGQPSLARLARALSAAECARGARHTGRHARARGHRRSGGVALARRPAAARSRPRKQRNAPPASRT